MMRLTPSLETRFNPGMRDIVDIGDPQDIEDIIDIGDVGDKFFSYKTGPKEIEGMESESEVNCVGLITNY
jgi:hypothetical protein